MQIKWLVVHTAAAARDGHIVRGVTAAMIDAWHRTRSFSGIGYHFVVEDDGHVAQGRSEAVQGAHARGLNGCSLGVCVTGHGDYEDFNEAQYGALIPLLVRLCRRHNLTEQNVMGHREAHTLAGAPDPHKTCPGTKVNLDHIRELVGNEILLAEAR